MICPVCGSRNTDILGTVSRFEKPFTIRICNDCRSSFQYPLPVGHENYYNEQYYSGEANFSYVDERRNEKFNQFVWNARIKNIRKFRKDGTFLDVGCSFGGLVRAASLYYDAWGMDISEYAVKNGNEFSFRNESAGRFKGLYKGSLIDIPAQVSSAAPFSVITMIEVAEHLENPADHFRQAFSLLKPGGLLVIQTANMTAWQALKEGLNYHYYLPGHLTCFSQAGLINLLGSIGFSRFRQYFPVDFGVLPKLRKMRGGFSRPRDYLKMWKTIRYHYSSYLKVKGNPLTSSWVVYAIK